MAGKKQGNSLQIKGNVKIGKGDIFTGDKTVIMGDHNKVGNQESVQQIFFEDLIRKIEHRPDTSTEEREDLKAAVEEFKTESQRGEKADKTFLSRCLRNIKRIAPDIADVMLSTIANPAAGFAMVIQKVAKRAKESTNK